MLANPPARQKRPDSKWNSAFDRIETQATSGIAIPIVYGELRVSGNIINQWPSHPYTTNSLWERDTQNVYVPFDGQPFTVRTAGNNVRGFQLAVDLDHVARLNPNHTQFIPVAINCFVKEVGFRESLGQTDVDGNFTELLPRFPVSPSTVSFEIHDETASDDGAGNIVGDFTGTITYASGLVIITGAPALKDVKVVYEFTSGIEFDAGDFTVTPRLGEFRVTADRDGVPIPPGTYEITVRLVDLNHQGLSGQTIDMPSSPGRQTRSRWRKKGSIVLKLSEWRTPGSAATYNPDENDFGGLVDPSTAEVKSLEKSVLNTLIAVCEGEIENASCMEVDENPAAALQNVVYRSRLGTSDQKIIPGFSEIVQSFQRNDLTEHNVPIFYTTQSNDIIGFELEFTAFGGIFLKRYHGTHYHPDSALIQLEFKREGDVTFTAGEIYNLRASKQSLIRFYIRRDDLTEGSYTIKITRTNAESNGTLRKNRMHLTRVNEISDDGLCYPNTALVAFQAMATEDLQGATPNINFVVRGKKVLDLRQLSPTPAWSNNPAWIVYDLFTNTRYGLGEAISASDLDESSFKSAANYYDQLVEDGEGNVERRFTCDIVFDSMDKPLDVIQQVLVSCRSYITWVDGKIKLRPDKDDPATQTFDEDNIVKDSFYFTYIPLHARANYVEVQFRNRAKNWDRDTIHVETLQALDGRVARITKSAELPGVTRESHALRLARYYLNSMQRVSVTCEFRVAALGLAAEPGDVILVTHPVARWTNKEMRILTIEESDSWEVKLNCVEHVPGIFNEADPPELAVSLAQELADPFKQPPPVVNLSISPVYKVRSAPKPYLVISYEAPTIDNPAADWEKVRFYRATEDGGPASYLGEDKMGQFEFGPVAINQGFLVYAASVNKHGVETPLHLSPREYVFTSPQRNNPRDVPKMWVSRVDKSLIITWTPPPRDPPEMPDTNGIDEEERLATIFGESTPIESFMVREGETWESAFMVAERVLGNSVTIPVPAIGRQLKYHVKARSFEGVFSTNPASYEIFVSKIPGRTVVQINDLLDPALLLAADPDIAFDDAKWRYALFENPASPPVIRTAMEVQTPATAFTVSTIEPARLWDDGSLWDTGIWDGPHKGEGEYLIGPFKFSCPDDPEGPCRTANPEIGIYTRKTNGVLRARYDDPWSIYDLAGLTYDFEATERVHYDLIIDGGPAKNISPGAEVRGCTFSLLTTLTSDWPIVAPEISTQELIFDLPTLFECDLATLAAQTTTIMLTEDFTQQPHITLTGFSAVGDPVFPIITSRSCNSFDVILVDCRTCGMTAGTIEYDACGV